MQNMQHSIEIDASKEKIWNVLWSDNTFRDWSSIIDEGTFMVGNLEEGSEVNFIGNKTEGVSYGVTAKVEKLTPNELISFTRIADIQVNEDGSISKRDKQWAGSLESYELEEHDHKITLSITQDVPEELVEYFQAKLPQALERIKELAEKQ